MSLTTVQRHNDGRDPDRHLHVSGDRHQWRRRLSGPGPTRHGTRHPRSSIAATVNTTTAVANATATYGDTSVTLNATVTPASGPAINSGSVTFTVKQGLTTIGVATTDTTVVAGAASVSYLLPAGTARAPYTH